jgi:uncharacterized RDD family membrane protein YckC
MENGYFILEDGEQTGPFTFEELLEKQPDVHSRILSPNENGWKDACDLPELYEYFLSFGLDFPTEDNLASFWVRLGAFIVDFIIWSLIIYVIMLGFLVSGHFSVLFHITSLQDIDKLPTAERLSLQIIANGTLLFYYTICESSSLKGTLGKRIFGLAVVNADGERITFLNSLVRSFGIVFLFNMLLGIGFLSIFFTENKQGLHDLLAKTYVIRRNI